MKKLSRFDIGMIVAFGVISLLGGGAWYYLSGQLQSAQQDASSAYSDFQKYSVDKMGNQTIIVNSSAGKTVQANIDLLNQEIAPIISDKLVSKDNKLASISNQDPVAWKRNLDDDVTKLTQDAKVHGVQLPGADFYFGFSAFLRTSPGDEQTAVLSKQLLAVDQISSILIEAPVKAIVGIRRTYEEEPRASGPNGGGGQFSIGGAGDANSDRLPGYSFTAPADAYRSYPFEIKFDTTVENLRTVVNKLVQSPYIFVLRTIDIENDHPDSPQVTDLQAIAATPSSSVVDSSPGEVANTTSTKGPQHLFGYSILHVTARIDMIEWTGTSVQ